MEYSYIYSRYIMNIYNKFNKKYGASAVILPPAPELLNKEITEKKPLPSQKVSPFLSQFILEEGEDALDPETFDKFEPEITKHRRHDLLPKEVEDDLEQVKRDMEDFQVPDKADQNDKTVPPPRRAFSADKLLKMCSKYHDLASK